jgi:hypothetical protein
MDPVEVAEEIIDDARLYFASYLHDRKRAALKGWGF